MKKMNFSVTMGFLMIALLVTSNGYSRTRKKSVYEPVRTESKKNQPKDQMTSHTQDSGKKWGAGAFIGTEIGLIGKYWLGEQSPWAFQGALGYDFGDAFMLFFDSLYHFKHLTQFRLSDKIITLNGYTGGGAKVVFDDPQVLVRIPVGTDFAIEKSPIDAFFQVAPAIGITPKTVLKVDIELGVRYYF